MGADNQKRRCRKGERESQLMQDAAERGLDKFLRQRARPIRKRAPCQSTGRPPNIGASAVQTRRARCARVILMKKRLLITGLILAALLLALYGVVFGTGAD